MSRISPRLRRIALAGAASAAVIAAPAAMGAFVLDGTVANTPGNLQPAGEPSIVLGSLKGVGNARVPWIAQVQPNPGGGADQIFTETFAQNQFVQQGDSLNFNPAENASHPDIDFAGGGFKVPWSAWEEPVGGVGQILASRFIRAAAGGGSWEINGALRGSPVVPSVQRGPTLNFNPDKAASEPRVAGGTLAPGGEPVPWVAWVEDASANGFGTQIFVTKGVKDGTPGPSQRGPFTWHIQGTDRGPAGIGPTLNVEINGQRDAVHPDIAFTGPSSTVPWVVWYEEPANGGATTPPNNQKVFASKFVPDPTLGDRGGRWVPVGRAAACGFQAGSEDAAACNINFDPNADAENPNVAAGSLAPGGVTVPWVAWKEDQGGVGKIRLSRLVGTTFQSFAGPNADGSVNADPTRSADEPDIRFEANVMVVTWKEQVGTKTHAFARRFTPGPNGQGGSWGPAVDLQVNPVQDAGNPAVGSFGGSPFVIWAEGAARADGRVFGSTLLKHDQATQQAITNDAGGITTSQATLNGAVTGDPGVYAVSFDAGPTTAYGQTVGGTDITLSAGGAAQAPATATLTGLKPDSVVHFRTRVATALGVVLGPDRAFTTAGSGAPGAIGLPPAAQDATAAPVPVRAPAARRARVRHQVRVSFRISRKWKVRITVRQRNARGRIVGSLVRKFPKGRSTVTVNVSTGGRLFVQIKPRAGKLVTRTVSVR